MKKISTDNIIKKFKTVHGDTYDYSKIFYVNYHTKIEIICKKHKSFYQTPAHHFGGNGCPKCGKISTGKKNTNTLKNFITKANNLHQNKYNYSKVNYVNCKTKVEIICPKHGSFFQTPDHHINQKNGCQKCLGKENLTKQIFLERSFQKHGLKYDYSLVEYVNSETKIKIICPKHGIFEQRAYSHFLYGCNKCAKFKSDDPLIDKLNKKIKNNLRSRLSCALKSNKKNNHTMNLIGCNIEELRDYLESKFTKEMNWNNYGKRGWHIDHIQPCAAFDLSKPEEQQKCFHYTNLQPLWWSENLKKGSKSG